MEIDRLYGLMARDQEDIDRLAVQARLKLTEIKSLSDRTEAMLATWKAARA